jgi:hypothetical protein
MSEAGTSSREMGSKMMVYNPHDGDRDVTPVCLVTQSNLSSAEKATDEEEDGG